MIWGSASLGTGLRGLYEWRLSQNAAIEEQIRQTVMGLAVVMIHYTVQRPGEGPAILNACRTLVSSAEFNRLTGLFAFATYRGATLLTSTLARASGSWRKALKRWVISIDGGITEPKALRHLLSASRSEVFIVDAEKVLRRNLVPIAR
ncbi:MAG: hypothetical protein ACLP00_19280, partial [Terracidiphilus sp.]